MDEGLADMQEAKKDKATDEHNVIDDAIADRGDGYTVFSIVYAFPFNAMPCLTTHYTACGCSLSPVREKAQERCQQELYGQSCMWSL